jgi:hypothetical protein
MKLNRWFSLAVLVLAGCSNPRPPADFLFANNAVWMGWMESTTDVRFKEVPLSKLPETPAFRQMNISIRGSDAALLPLQVSLDAKGVTRRQALWMIAEEYDLNMTVGYVGSRPFYVEITKRPDEDQLEKQRRFERMKPSEMERR